MPFKSSAQERLFRAKEARGDLPLGTADEWSRETNYRALPERKGSAPKKRKKKFYGEKE